MKSFFENCSNLTSLNLSNFNTLNVYRMWDMFNGCKSLKYLNISSFNTSKVTDMESMFESCSSLDSLDLSHFNTTKVYYMNKMFRYCSNLKFINFKNIKSNSLGTMTEMFKGCSNLEYINLYSLNKSSQSIENMFYSTSNNFIYCIENETSIPQIYSLIGAKNNVIRDCSSNCYPQPRKLIIETNKCEYYNCSENETHPFDYNHVCYSDCPKRTYNKINTTLCEDLNCSYYNFEQTECIDKIPDGFFLNDSILKTIDKCHSDCKTCNQKESENNTNCNSCNSEKFLYFGNCLSECKNEYYLDAFDNSIKICKCENIKCFNCSLESLNYDLCISCNDNYYPKYNDSSNVYPYINCYQNLDGYYLDTNDNYYKLCYPSCQTCNETGNENNNNCLKCKENYSFKDYFPADKNCYPECSNYYYFNNETKYFCTEEKKCPEEYNKLIEAKGRCIDQCSNDNTYRYEFKKKCYSDCPPNTKKNKFYCKIECPIELPYEIVETQECVQNCSDYDIEKKICIVNNENALLKENKEDEFLGNIQEKMEDGNYNLTDIENGGAVKYKTNNTEITLTTADDLKDNENNNVTTINLGECENKIKDYYNISRNKSLYILQILVNENGMKIPKVEYEVYFPFNGENLIKLNLSVCQKMEIDVSIPVNINEKDLDKHDSKSSYYHDICYPSKSDKGIDITLKDRKKEFIENNYTLCEEDCEFKGYDSLTKKALCSCEVKMNMKKINEISIDKDRLSSKFGEAKNAINLEVTKCYYALFTKKGIINNIGCYIIFSIILLHFICIIFFYLKDYKIIKIKINDILFALKNKQNFIKKEIKVDHKRKNNKSKTQKIRKKLDKKSFKRSDIKTIEENKNKKCLEIL